MLQHHLCDSSNLSLYYICQCHVLRNFSPSFVCNSVIQQLVLLMICVNIMWYLDTGNSFLFTYKKQVILVNIKTD